MANSFEPIGAASFGGAQEQSDAAGQPWFASLAGSSAFSLNARFGGLVAEPEVQPDEEADAVLADALADAERRGREAALSEMASEGAARAALKLSLQRLDDRLREDLAQQLAEAVAMLCEQTLAPLALDRDALHRRCSAVAALLGDGVAEATLRLHPDDIGLLSGEFASQWNISPDPALVRGTVQFDRADGALRDGPENWRMALREALGLC